ncbi:MAG: PilC/PilY family type IV pilus protein [Methylotetracoccus sp.]
MVLCAAAVLAAPSLRAGNIAQSPLFIGISAPPLVMITMGRDHKLYYEAYNDASDLDGDGVLDTRYNPTIEYFGYFDSHKCYSYSSGVFTPASNTDTKTCSGNWSGDYLNYLTTSRMDALRRVLYGGYRSSDTTTETILERVLIPQDAHSWGKEYTSVAVDGYDITQYTPLTLPAKGTRHIFANTTLLSTTTPLLRVLTNSSFRVWEWLSIERPVAGTECATGNNVRSNCAVAGSTFWEIVPAGYFTNLTQTVYNTTGYGTYPTTTAQFDTLVTNYGIVGKRLGTGAAATINGTTNPFTSQQDNYLTIFSGTLVIPAGEGGTYTFAIDGDDAIDLKIDGTLVASWYAGHGACGCNTHTGTATLTAGNHTILFRHQEKDGDAGYYLRWQKSTPDSSMTDYTVRVKACMAGLLESECRPYKSGTTTTYKPAGLLNEHGESDSMMFGLLTGSYTKNTSGGILRKNILSFKNEVNAATGQYLAPTGGGIIDTINKLKTVGFGGTYQYTDNCTVPEVNNPLAEGDCRMWGNPTAEMMYESLRYFAGKTGPSSDFSIGTTGDDATLSLSKPTWSNPYTANMGTNYTSGYPSCSKPSQLVISDINPNYDTDKVPGTYFGSYSGDLAGFDASAEAQAIWSKESEASNIFIGQSGSTFDGAPTPKSVSSFKNIRGLAPEGPTLQGGFYSASAAQFGKLNDLNAVAGPQKADTLSVVLASPLPRIEIPVNGKVITLVPFGKTVGGCGTFSRNAGSYQPTNTIVDFYVDTIKNTGTPNHDDTVNAGRPFGRFRINYEDSEYGSDHDMDAIVEYTFTVAADNTVSVALNSNYAAGGCIQHMGYVVSGTTRDGTYLEVRDSDTASGSDVDYFLDTPPGQLPGGTWSDSQALPLSATRTFTAGTTTSASYLKHDPLWYAAKWGGFYDRKDPSTNLSNNQLDGDEWDLDHDGVPDSYFLVTHAGKLKEQLTKAFNEIKSRIGSASSIATNSTRLDTGTFIYQAKFNSTDWSGQLLAFKIDSDGAIHDNDGNGIIDERDAFWDAAKKLPAAGSRNIYTYNPLAAGTKGTIFSWANLNATQQTALVSADVVNYLRGDQTEEKHNDGLLRDRSNRLGDIVNSDPLFVGSENYGYESLASEGSSYSSFLQNKASRTKMIYVGANDGMLHGFVASEGTNEGVESFAYVPNSIIGANLLSLSSDPYTHKYLVDGSPRGGDVFVGGAWKTILVGTTGGGGKGVFALDVTSPGSFGTGNVMWEFSDTDGPSDVTDPLYYRADVGYSVPQPAIGRMYNGSWAAIVANGYNSASGKAVLFIINAANGQLIAKLDTKATGNTVVTKNGLSTPIAVDVPRVMDLNGDGTIGADEQTPVTDRIIDYIYAGDLAGNLWKFDVTGTSASSWTVAGGGSTPSPFFVACAAAGSTCSDANRQPITGKPQVGLATDSQQDGGVMVYFGTGKYFEENDNVVPATPQIQSFYGLWDRNSGTFSNDRITDRTTLQAQSITAETSKGGFNLRLTSANSVYYQNTTLSDGSTVTAKKGWYMDLVKPPSSTREGERVVSFPLLRGERVVFVTLIPSANPCDYGGTSWLMEMNAINGARLNTPPWDIYGAGGKPDGKIDDQDMITINGQSYAPSGKQSNVGIIKTPGVIAGGNLEYKYTSGSSGDLEMTRETGGAGRGRQTWVQIR